MAIRRFHAVLLVAALVAVPALPSSALAADDLPAAIDDPVAAIAPVEDEPVAEAEALPSTPQVAEETDAQSTIRTPVAAPATATARPSAPTATLPFTGLGTDALVFAGILGTLFVLAGVTAFAGSRAAGPAHS